MNNKTKGFWKWLVDDFSNGCLYAIKHPIVKSFALFLLSALVFGTALFATLRIQWYYIVTFIPSILLIIYFFWYMENIVPAASYEYEKKHKQKESVSQ